MICCEVWIVMLFLDPKSNLTERNKFSVCLSVSVRGRATCYTVRVSRVIVHFRSIFAKFWKLRTHFLQNLKYKISRKSVWWLSPSHVYRRTDVKKLKVAPRSCLEEKLNKQLSVYYGVPLLSVEQHQLVLLA